MSDFASMRVRRGVLTHAHQIEEALRRKGYEHLPPELQTLASEGNLSAITDLGYHLLAEVLGVRLEEGSANGRNSTERGGPPTAAGPHR